MKLNTKQAMANDVNKNAGPILVSAFGFKHEELSLTIAVFLY